MESIKKCRFCKEIMTYGPKHDSNNETKNE